MLLIKMNKTEDILLTNGCVNGATIEYSIPECPDLFAVFSQPLLVEFVQVLFVFHKFIRGSSFPKFCV